MRFTQRRITADFLIDEPTRRRYPEGLDDIALALAHTDADAIDDFETRRRAWFGQLSNSLCRRPAAKTATQGLATREVAEGGEGGRPWGHCAIKREAGESAHLVASTRSREHPFSTQR